MQCQDIRMSLIGICAKVGWKWKCSNGVGKKCTRVVNAQCALHNVHCTCNGFEFHVSITIVAHAMYYFLSFAIKQGGNGENKTLPSSIIIRSIHRIICNVLLDNQDRTRLQRHWWWKENSTRWEAVGNTGPSVGVLKGGYRNLTGRSDLKMVKKRQKKTHF